MVKVCARSRRSNGKIGDCEQSSIQKDPKRQVKDSFKYAFICDVCHRCLCVISNSTVPESRKGTPLKKKSAIKHR